ncbi:phasin family protein [Novosphingobium album (ex Hu et al. 2023)]|uniref:Phasin family protein n=1 Tax=Novosphingobium album (ex Hu et al. 2023) TaxID=2930093 RepID=A0ABT0B0K9_9SPHN|nr:phasin family protein [Novosphingobium album (ex Hu et al. 2023)]MCJ2178453.1 phasin family protein [Novosphingobium album (ex Hu et al. 2023)]
MAANEDPKDIAATDKAYQAASDAVPVKPAAKKVPARKAKAASAKVEGKPAQPKPAAAPKAAPAKVVAKPKPAPKPKPVAKTPVAAKPVSKVVPVKAAAEPAAKVVEEKPAPAAASPKAATPKAAKTASDPAFAGLFTNFMLEEKIMDMSPNFAGFQEAVTEAQAKAKEAFEKSTKALGEVSDFTKGNVEAVVESGKILAEGMQSIGSELVSEGRSAFETMTGDIKELAAAKSPTDFFKIQSEMMRKNFDSAVAYGSKNSETMLKLASDVFAPISGRVSMAMEKARSAAL